MVSASTGIVVLMLVSAAVQGSAAVEQGLPSAADAGRAPDASSPPPGKRSRAMGVVPAGNPANWFSADNYPPAALRAGRQGRVVVDLGIDTGGSVVTCDVKSSSGTAVLDQGTCAVAREHGRFDPATDRRGRPIVGHYIMPVRWVIPEASPEIRDVASLPRHEAMAMKLFFSAEGTLASCETLESAGEGKTDPCAGQKIGERGAVVTRQGRPVPYQLVRRYSQDLSTDE